jgi:putative DNA primase/helicase
MKNIAALEQIQRLEKERDAALRRVRELEGGGQANGFDDAAAPLHAYTADEFLTLELPPRETIIKPWLTQKGLVLIHSRRGVGKTHFGMTSAYAIAVGQGFLGFAVPSARKVLYLDGEMPAETMQRRLAALALGFTNQPPDPSYFRILSADMIDGGMPDLGTDEGRARVDAIVGDAEVLFADNLTTLVRSGKENETEGWRPIQEWTLAHRRGNRAVVLFHHDGKSGAQRGASSREDILDTVLHLRHPADYDPQQGARFEGHWEKNRGFHGPDAVSFEAQYEERDDKAVWTRKTIVEVEAARVVAALKEKMSIRETADYLQMHRSKVERLKKWAQNNGKLNG